VRGIAGLETPLVGRDREMAASREVLEHLRQGRGQPQGGEHKAWRCPRTRSGCGAGFVGVFFESLKPLKGAEGAEGVGGDGEGGRIWRSTVSWRKGNGLGVWSG
jgi:hypothetical protein